MGESIPWSIPCGREIPRGINLLGESIPFGIAQHEPIIPIGGWCRQEIAPSWSTQRWLAVWRSGTRPMIHLSSASEWNLSGRNTSSNEVSDHFLRLPVSFEGLGDSPFAQQRKRKYAVTQTHLDNVIVLFAFGTRVSLNPNGRAV